MGILYYKVCVTTYLGNTAYLSPPSRPGSRYRLAREFTAPNLAKLLLTYCSISTQVHMRKWVQNFKNITVKFFLKNFLIKIS